MGRSADWTNYIVPMNRARVLESRGTGYLKRVMSSGAKQLWKRKRGPQQTDGETRRSPHTYQESVRFRLGSKPAEVYRRAVILVVRHRPQLSDCAGELQPGTSLGEGDSRSNRDGRMNEHLILIGLTSITAVSTF
jgi:hypothetical protein